jgi:hypothetical protein
MFVAKTAIFFGFHAVGVVLLFFHRVVIALFTFGAG